MNFEELENDRKLMGPKDRRKFDKAMANYQNVCGDYGIATNLPDSEQLSKLIDAAEDIQSQICKRSDNIKIDYYNEVSQLMKISKPVWLRLVNLNNRRGNISDKALAKIKEKINDDLLYINTQYQFLKNDFNKDFSSDTTNIMHLPEDDEVDFAENYSNNADIDKILEKATEDRYYISTVLNKEYKRIKEAVEFLTNGELTKAQFKNLVDDKHYLGGYPNPTSKGKMEAFTDKIQETYESYSKFGLKMFGEYLEDRGLQIIKI